MSNINSVSSTYAANNVNFNNSGAKGVYDLKLGFTPEELGVKRGRDGKFPPEARFTEQQAEKALFKFFGLNPANPQDLKRIQARRKHPAVRLPRSERHTNIRRVTISRRANTKQFFRLIRKLTPNCADKFR